MLYFRFSWLFLGLLVFCFVLDGCATYEGNQKVVDVESSSEKITIAVMPFRSVSEARGSGMIVSDTLANQIYVLDRYHVITPEVVASRLVEKDIEALTPAEAGSLLGAPYIVTGRVTEYTYKTGVGETPAVGVTVRLIDTASSAVVWSATRTGVGGGNWFQEESLSSLTFNICKDLADSMNAFLIKRLAGYSGSNQSGATAYQSAPATR